MRDDTSIPSALGPEKAVLSVMLARPSRFLTQAAVDGLTLDHFHLPAHALLFDRLMDGRDRHSGDSFDLAGFVQELADAGDLDKVGGPATVYEVYQYAPNACHWTRHLKILRDHHARRIAMAAATEAREVASHDAVEAQRLLEQAAKRAQDALQPPSAILEVRAATELFINEIERRHQAGEIPGIPTGILPLDLLTGGPKAGELWVVAGETSAGKSILLLQLASHAAIQHAKRALIASLEMGAAELVARMVACNWSIPLDVINMPAKAHKADLLRIRKAIEKFIAAPVAILADDRVDDDGDSLTIHSIDAYTRRYADQHGLDMLVVDYLQLVSGDRRKGDSREQEVASVSRRLKRLARRLHIPVLTASQLNDDGRLRESRAIGQDADVILAIQSGKDQGLKVLKNRNGKRGDLLPVRPMFHYQRFDSI